MYIDNSGIEHESYDAACHYYGVDTPDQVRAEMEEMQREWEDHCFAYGTWPVWPQEEEVPF